MKRLLFTIIIIVGISFSSFAQNKGLKVGDKAPEFSATTDDGSVWDLKNYVGKQNIIVYFFPAAMTSGCTKEACAYRDVKNEIQSADALVVGISGDNVEGLKLFKKAENLNFPLLSDSNGEIAAKFGVPTRDGGKITREIDGKSYDLERGVTASRWTFIINKEGNIVNINEQVDAPNDATQVLQFMKKNL